MNKITPTTQTAALQSTITSKRIGWNAWIQAPICPCNKTFAAAKGTNCEAVSKVAFTIFHHPKPLNGLEAILNALQPCSEKATLELLAYIIKGDIAGHVKKNMSCYREQLKIHNIHDEKEANEKFLLWSSQMLYDCKEIDLFEMEVLSDIFKLPIHILYPNGRKVSLGEEYTSTPIHLRWDPKGYF